MTSRSDLSSISADRAIAETYRADWGRLLSVLVGRTRRLDLAEDALGEAFARASDRWPTGGVPANPAGWLYTTASRLIIARLRAEAIHGRKVRLLAVDAGWVPPESGDELDAFDDDRLALILLCCHPAVHPEARAPLALRLVVGTTTEEIARLHLVSVATMAARITRAKKKIVAAGIPLSSPVDDELRTRLDGVCRTIYLAFTAGYAPGRGADLLRQDLAGEAVALAAILHRLVPDAPQACALYALLLLQHARRDARLRNGRLVTLRDQDRSLWFADELSVGMDLVASLTPAGGYAEELRLQGLIACEHARAPTAEDTDWSSIASHYLDLEALTGSPVVRLNRAVAVAETEGALAGLAILSELDQELPHNHRLPAVRAELARRAGNVELARASYDQAIDRCSNEVERAYLSAQRDALDLDL
jgi:RNA polymerase sigma-70 factor (ECF subfamily)